MGRRPTEALGTRAGHAGVVLALLAFVFALLVAEPALGKQPPPPPPPPPVIDSLSTYQARPGSIVVIYGSGFGAEKRQSEVWCAGVRANPDTWSDTQITFLVPRDCVAPGYVGVIVEGVMSNGVYFIPFALPQVASVTPTQAQAGDVVTISGSDFGRTQETGWVTFAGTPGTVVSWSDTAIQAVVPEGAHAGYLGVVQDGVTSNGVFFVPFGMPAVQDVSADYALVGDTVTVTGANFGGQPDEVLVGGVPVAAASWSDTQVTFEVPPEVTQGYVGVRRDGITSNGVFVNIAPRLHSVSSWWAAPGSTVTITGTGFGPGADGWVSLGGRDVPVVSWTPTEVVARIPDDGATGLIGVVRGNWATSNGKDLVVTSQATITGVSSAEVWPGQELTITGADFGPPAGTSKVLIAGVHECAVVSWSDTSIVVTVPDGVSAGYVGVHKQGVPSNGRWVDLGADVPRVTGISEWWGLPGTQVTITGTGFRATQGASQAVFAGVPAEVVSWSDTAVTAVVPTGASTGYAGIVRDGITSNGVYFMPYRPPAISSVSTSTAAVGEQVVVTGSGFRDSPGTLTLADVPIAWDVWTDTTIVFTVPAGAVSGYVGVKQDDKTSNGVWLRIGQ